MRGTSTLRIAWRNLWRSWRRTGLALSAIGLSVMLVLAYDAILRAYGDWMLETITGPMLGHVQVHAPGWRKDRAMDRTLRGVSSVLEALRRDPEVAGAGARLYAPALAALAEEGFAVVVLGVDPSLANDLFKVAALIETSVDLVNRQAVIMDLGEAQDLFAMPDEAHEIVVHARDPARLQETVAAVRSIPGLKGAEVLDWQALAPEMVTLVQLVGVAGVFVLILVFIAAAAGVANTMLMATFERTHEFGMLLALGTGPGRIVRMIVSESVVLGVLGALVGAALGILLVASTHHSGIDFAALTGRGPSGISFAGMRWSMRFYPSLALVDVAQVVAAAVVTSLVASVWPAVRAARLQPAEALRE